MSYRQIDATGKDFVMVRFHWLVTATVVIPTVLLDAHAVGARAQARPDTMQTVLGTVPDDDDEEVRTETVAIDASALADQVGRAAVMVRIKRAVSHVCGIDETGTLAERDAYERCSTASLDNATTQLNVLLARNATGPLRIASAEPRF